MAPVLVASATADAIERESDEVILPRRAEAIMKLTPRPIVDWLVGCTGWRRGAGHGER